MADNMNQAFGWDDEVNESEFEILPDGDYIFTVTGFERAFYEPRTPDSKIGACQQANIEFTIKWTNSAGIARENKLVHKLKLWRSLEFLIYQFFECVGLKKKGDGSSVMPWGQIIGKTGICAIGHHTDNKGNDYNDIVKCYPTELAPTVVKNGNNQEPAAPKFSL